MRIVAKVDGQGNFVEDVLLGEDEDTPAGCVEERPPEGLYVPMWTGSAWEEGKPEVERLASSKASKRAELEAAYDAECRRDFSSAFAAAGVLAVNPQDARVGALKTRTARLRDRLAAVEAATTQAQVGAVSWT